MKFRALCSNDLKALCTLLSSCSIGWSEPAIRDELRDYKHIHVLGAFSGEALVGCISFSVVAEEAELRIIAVHPSMQRAGIASRLHQALYETCLGKGCRFVHLEVDKSNSAATGFYFKLGYRKTGERAAYYEGGDALLMKLEL